jgi:hypothetical protein
MILWGRCFGAVLLLFGVSAGYDGPVASVYHGYPGSQSYVNINFHEPDQKQVDISF